MVCVDWLDCSFCLVYLSALLLPSSLHSELICTKAQKSEKLPVLTLSLPNLIPPLVRPLIVKRYIKELKKKGTRECFSGRPAIRSFWSGGCTVVVLVRKSRCSCSCSTACFACQGSWKFTKANFRPWASAERQSEVMSPNGENNLVFSSHPKTRIYKRRRPIYTPR